MIPSRSIFGANGRRDRWSAIGFLVLIALGGMSCGVSTPSTLSKSDRPDAKPDSERESGNRLVTPQESEPIPEPPSSLAEGRSATIANAISLMQNQKHDAAIGEFRRLVLADPRDFEALFFLANAHATKGDFATAIDLLSDIPSDDPTAGLPSLGVSADWCFQSERFDEAEARYLKILELDPTANLARRQLAYLYNRQGRRHEAVRLIRQLCESGDVLQDELHALIVESDAMYDVPGTTVPPNVRPYWPIGVEAEARYLFTEKRYHETAELLRELVTSGDASPSANALYGIAICEAQEQEKFDDWLVLVDDRVKEFPEYWSAIGNHLIRQAKYEPAIRAFSEALLRDPTDFRSIRRIIQGFRSLELVDEVAVWNQRYDRLMNAINASVEVATVDADRQAALLRLASELDLLERRIESLLWRSIAAVGRPDASERLSELNEQRESLIKRGSAFPNQDALLCGLNINRFSRPTIPSLKAGGDSEKHASDPPPIPSESLQLAEFRDVAAKVNLKHTYKIATQAKAKAFAIYQTFGGGVAILDYDQDGQPDIYLAQGAADPPTFIAVDSDVLYRNVLQNDARFAVNVSLPAGVTELQYTLGVTSGDWNQDGFPDVAVANIGINRLLINQGDGTFVSHPLDEREVLSRLDTSLAMADVTGDQLPDLYSLGYLDDEEGIVWVPSLDNQGNVTEIRAPLSYKSTHDRLYINLPDGKWRMETIGNVALDACTGLGVVITNFDHSIGNEVYVGNDGMKNQLWFPSESSASTKQWEDRGAVLGCAYSSLGTRTASMGIAAADYDRNGWMDLHVTNFFKESANLYLQDSGLFRDQNIRTGLDRDSMPMVGFGSQPIDVSNDGWPDLIVANGHVEDLEHQGEPFKQKSQIFSNRGNRFELSNVIGSTYLSNKHLGRAVAVLDFDRDGTQDFVVTDMIEPTELLLGRSTTGNHWIDLQLVGTKSERDAIGSSVTIKAGDEHWTSWVTAGDGYLCKNESVLHFGLGKHGSISGVEVKWPDGTVESFEADKSDCRLLLVEGQKVPFVQH